MTVNEGVFVRVHMCVCVVLGGSCWKDIQTAVQQLLAVNGKSESLELLSPTRLGVSAALLHLLKSQKK